MLLRLGLFGGDSVCLQKYPVLSSNKKAVALISYLYLTENRRNDRERLAFLFWGDSGEKHARSSLRQALLTIRNALREASDPIIISDKSVVRLDIDLVGSDFGDLMQSLADGLVPELLLREKTVTRNICSALRGASEAFDQFVDDFQTEAETRIRASLRSLCSDIAIPDAEKSKAHSALLLLDPLDEQAVRDAMEFHGSKGNKAQAMAVFSSFSDLVSRELGVGPTETTVELADSIKRGSTGSTTEFRQERTPVQAFVTAVPMVAVLPFELAVDTDREGMLARSLQEDIVCMLACLQECRVLASSSASQPAALIDNELKRAGVDYCLLGLIRQRGDGIVISARLTHLSSQQVVWAHVFETTLGDLFAAQLDIATRMVAALVPSVRMFELRRFASYEPKDLGAFHLNLRARDKVFQLRHSSFVEARELLDQSIERDPGFAPTYLELSDWYSIRIFQGWSDDRNDDTTQLEHMAEMALQLSANNGRALSLIAHNRAIIGKDYDRALEMFDHAVASMPGDSSTLLWTCPTLAWVGEGRQALKNVRRAIDLSPFDPFMFRYEHFLSIALYSLGEYEEAARAGLNSFAKNPSYTSNLRMTTAALAALGDIARAQKVAKVHRELEKGFSVNSYIKSQAFRDPQARETYAKHLIAGGLPV